MNKLASLISAIIELNANNDVVLSHENLKKANLVSELSVDTQEKVCVFSDELIKFDNEKVLEKINKISDEISDFFFKYIEGTELDNTRKYSDLFLQYYMAGRLTIIELEKCLKFMSNINENYFNFIWWIKCEGTKCFNSEYGQVLWQNGFAKKIFKIGDIEYKLNLLGEKLFDNMHLDLTKKEKACYSKIIDFEVMATKMTAQDHKKYYEKTMKLIVQNESYIKMLRTHERSFKDFIEEYGVLIKYVTTKYGEKQKMRFCGHETTEKIKSDGIIFTEKGEEKIEVTYPLFNVSMNNDMKELNNYGHTSVKTIDPTDYKSGIRNRIEDKIDEKNKNDSYDESITLVVALDMYEFLFDKKIKEKEYYDDLLKDIKKKKYKFKDIDVLIENNQDSAPWIYIIK